jgi:hypothetical protein
VAEVEDGRDAGGLERRLEPGQQVPHQGLGAVSCTPALEVVCVVEL